MKIKKFGAIAAAALVVTSLAMSASAANLSDTDTPVNTGLASVVAVDVDLSGIDWTSIQPGELIPVGEIDPDTISAACTIAEGGVASVVAVEGVDLSDLDLTNLEAGELEVIGTIDPATVPGGFTTAAASK